MYNFKAIEQKWQHYWLKNHTFRADRKANKPKYYVLDMFPYPSGAGLHVGHPLGYIATDIIAKYKKLCGYNVLHPMGFDAFGLPAEQYAIETGTHPAITTGKNIQRFKEQLTRIGLMYDPDTVNMKTCDPEYYKWTQWIFLQIFNSWYNLSSDKAEPISTLIRHFETYGVSGLSAYHSFEGSFSADEWKNYSEEEKQKILLHFRMAYTAEMMVNWCPALGTVLANDEVINGVSERGGHPVIRKPMRQWVFRMTAYAERLLEGLENIDWPTPIKEIQRNWIGKSTGSSLYFETEDGTKTIEAFTTRPDTVFGSTFLVIAPEHELVEKLTTPGQATQVNDYITQASAKSEIERLAGTKQVSGVFTGSYAIHPFTREKLPIWIADYVLGGYGTGAIMAVPAHDSRDYAFAKHFNLRLIPVIEGGNISEEAYEAKSGKMINSDFLNGLEVNDAIPKAIEVLEQNKIGYAKVNYRLRDPNFSRQRYWGEPFPIVYRNGVPFALAEEELPVLLPEVDSYEPAGNGQSPLAKLEAWVSLPDGSLRETNTMPGYAGSSWYFFRYLSPQNDHDFVDPGLERQWMNVDLYVGGAEHATGHLLYARFWTKVLFDLGLASVDEPFQKLVNQGMIQGRSSIVYRIKDTNTFVSKGLKESYETTPIRVDVNIVQNDILDLTAFKAWKPGFANAEFILEEGKYYCGAEVEKMSKRWHNVVNPDDVCDAYGADTFRMYEMFLGPLEDSKPFDLNGIEGVYKFLKRTYRLFTDEQGQLNLSDEAASDTELRALHKMLKKVEEDIERLSFNTCVSAFMIFINEMYKLKCRKKAVLKPYLIALSSFAPHLSEELWEKLGEKESIFQASWLAAEEKYLKEASYAYPVSINGKVKTKLELPLGLSKEELSEMAMSSKEVQNILKGKTLKRIIAVPGRIINLVI